MFLILWRNWPRFVWEETCRWSSAAREINTDEWHMHELKNSHLAGFEHISEWNKAQLYWNYFVIFLVLERILYILIFSHTKRCLASEDTCTCIWNLVKERNVHVKNATFILSVLMLEECWPVICKGWKTRKLKLYYDENCIFPI